MKTSVIWNITNKCPYSCSFCCLNANGPAKDLGLEDKLRIVDHLDIGSVRLDISGGEPLMSSENLEVIGAVSQKFGRSSISVTSTGKGLERVDLSNLSKCVSEVGFTYDSPYEPSDRPDGYNSNNLEWGVEFLSLVAELLLRFLLLDLMSSPERFERFT